MNKQCELVQDLLPLYVDGICSRTSTQLVEEHLISCPECTQVCNNLKNKECDDILRSETESVVAHHTKSQKRKTFVIGSCIAGILCIPIIVCLIVNLAVGHALDWFFIVLTSLMVFASLVVVPLVAEKKKGLLTIGSFTISLLLLLLTCAIFTKGDWFWVTSSSVLFGLAVLLMPYVAYQLPLDPFWRNNKGLLVFITDTILLIVMLLCIGFYADDPMYWKSTPPPLLYVACFAWVFFFVCRYLRVSKIIRAGANCILTGVFIFSANYMIDLIVGNDPAWPIINMNTWNELSIDGNVKWIILISTAGLGAALIILGFVRNIMKKK